MIHSYWPCQKPNENIQAVIVVANCYWNESMNMKYDKGLINPLSITIEWISGSIRGIF